MGEVIIAKAAPQQDVDQLCWARAERREAALSTTLRAGDMLPGEATILNISPSGCLIEAARDLPTGAAITLGLGGWGAVPARVIRRDDGCRYGCAFDRLLPEEALAKMDPGATLVRLRFGEEAEADRRWPRAVRLLFAFGAAALLWAAILSLV